MCKYAVFDPRLSIDGEHILFIGSDQSNDKMFKYLGLYIQDDLKSDRFCAKNSNDIETWIKLINDCLLSGPMKCWILNHGVFGKLSCALMIHDIPATLRDRWQRLSHKYFRNWIGLASSAEPSVLYRSRENFGLQFRNFRQLTKELGVKRWRNS